MCSGLFNLHNVEDMASLVHSSLVNYHPLCSRILKKNNGMTKITTFLIIGLIALMFSLLTTIIYLIINF
jgi:hypothetical protein